MIFVGFKSGFATATEISAFAVLMRWWWAAWCSASSASGGGDTSSNRHALGLVLFIVASAQSLAFVLTLQQVPHAVAE